MKNSNRVRYWIDKPVDGQITQNLERLSVAPGVQRIAVMPDIHLAKKICNGVAVATCDTIFPEAVGGDIGCGYLMADVSGSASAMRNKRTIEKLLRGLDRYLPIIRHPKETMVDELPSHLSQSSLSDPSLNKLKSRDARVQFGTLGRGNHFVELQTSVSGLLHILIHSGSRAVGPAVLAHHLKSAQFDNASKLYFLSAHSDSGKAYLNDAKWARDYASANRYRMVEIVDDVLKVAGLAIDFGSVINRDHNHVQQESHNGHEHFVHRKGTQRIAGDEIGIIPGSMGTASFVVRGRDSVEALESCSHGAGRKLSRTQAAKRISAKDLKSQMQRVHYDHQKNHRLRDEAPGAYKDIRKVMRAQKDLVRIEQERQPILNFKSG